MLSASVALDGSLLVDLEGYFVFLVAYLSLATAPVLLLTVTLRDDCGLVAEDAHAGVARGALPGACACG